MDLIRAHTGYVIVMLEQWCSYKPFTKTHGAGYRWDNADASQHTCCRVYSRTATGAGHKLLEQKERECVAAAVTVVCLSRSDADNIRTRLMPAGAARHPQVSVKGWQPEACSQRQHSYMEGGCSSL